MRSNREENEYSGDNKNSDDEIIVGKPHGKAGWTAARLAYLGMFTAAAMVLSYLETFIPLSVAVPGVKIGLANLVTVVLLYRLGARDAWLVSIVRVCLSSLLFGNMTVLAYSMDGAVVSLACMTVSRRTEFFGVTGTSIIGGVTHNAGQIAVAALLMNSRSILLYMPVLGITGAIAGVAIGLLGAVLVKRLPEF